MKPRTTDRCNFFSWHRLGLGFGPRSPRLWGRRWVKRLMLALSAGLLTACVASSPYGDEMLPPASESTTSPSVEGAYAQPSPSPSPSDTADAAAQFNFPLTTCGDRTSEPSETWYSVFIDNGDINEIRSRYCGDAISTTRENSGTATVQVASFTSYAKALTLAQAIGGVVEQTAQAASNPADSSAAASPSPAAPAASVQVGQSAYLNASDATVPINIRQSASTDAEVQSTGLAGERVQIANATQGNDGYTWYEVRLESGATGWVRGDLVTAQPSVASQAPDPSSSQPPADSQHAQSEPPPAQPYPQPSQPSQAPAYPQQPYPPTPPAYEPPPYAQSPYGQAPYGGSYGQNQPYGQPPYNQPPYAQSPYGQPPYSQPAPAPNGMPPYGTNRNSTLTARDPGAAINIREFASPNSRVRYLANPGDRVQISGSAQGDDGQMWYQVRFSSGAVGWVRGDLVAAN